MMTLLERRRDPVKHSPSISVPSAAYKTPAETQTPSPSSPSTSTAKGNEPRQVLVSRATAGYIPPSPTRPRPRRRSLQVSSSKSSSAIPTLSSFAIPRALPTYLLPSMSNASTGNATAADLLRQVAMQR